LVLYAKKEAHGWEPVGFDDPRRNMRFPSRAWESGKYWMPYAVIPGMGNFRVRRPITESAMYSAKPTTNAATGGKGM
jgi:hypothetical protein